MPNFDFIYSKPSVYSNNKIAFLIATYPPHFKQAKRFLKSFKKHNIDQQADLYYVFTNEREACLFGEYIDAIILPENLRIFENHGIITIKKFYGLIYLKDKYEFIFNFDSESKIIKNIDLAKLCERYFNNKILYGNTAILTANSECTNDELKIKALSYFDNSNKKINIRNNELFCWFNQLCIYKTEHFDEWFNIIDIYNKIKYLTSTDFEYYIYMYYLILYKDFTIEDLEVKARFGMMEAYEFTPITNKYKTIDFYACNPKIYHKIKNDTIFAFIQMDQKRPWYMFFLYRQLRKHFELKLIRNIYKKYLQRNH